MDNRTALPKRWILIRGLTRSYFHWFNFTLQLKSELNIEVIDCPELPGNGYSSKQTSPTSLKEAVLLLKNQINPISEPVGIIGLSMGGMIATQWALDYPHEVGKLVLINSSFSLNPFYQRLKPSVYASLFKCLLNPKPESIEKFIFRKTCNTDNWKNYLKESIQFHIEHPIAIKNFIRQLLMTKQSQFTTAPKCPVQLLVAENDRLVNSQCTRTIATKWNLPVHVHLTAGHDLPMDDSTWIIEQIKKG